MASVGSSTVAMIRVLSMVSPRWRASLVSSTRTAPDCLRNLLLVASRAVRDLLLCAKHLFVAAMVVTDKAVFGEQILSLSAEARVPPCHGITQISP